MRSGFLLVIGMTLVAEGFGTHVPKGYIYAAMAFSALVEGLNMLARRAKTKRRRALRAVSFDTPRGKYRAAFRQNGKLLLPRQSSRGLTSRFSLLVQPSPDRIDDVLPLRFIQRFPRLDAVPFRETAPAARRRRMLRDENRVAAKRRLLAVVRRGLRREPLVDQFARVPGHFGQALLVQISQLARAEPEAPAKRRLR